MTNDTYAAKRARRSIDGRPVVCWWRLGMVDRRGKTSKTVTAEQAAHEALTDEIEDDNAPQQRR